MNKLIFLAIVVLLIGFYAIDTTNAQCGLLCVVCNLLDVCLLSQPIEINSLTSLTKSLSLQSILTLSAILNIDGDLLCNGTINLLGGVLNVKGAIKVTPLCVFNVTGPCTVDATAGFTFPLLTVLFYPSGGNSILNWKGDASASFTNLIGYGGELPKFNFYGQNVNLTTALVTTPIKIGYASVNQATNLYLNGIQFDQLFINQLTNPANLAVQINNLTISQATATLGSALTPMSSIALRQSSNLLINQPLTVNSLTTVVTSTLQLGSTINILSGTLSSGTVSVLANGIINLAGATLNTLNLNVIAGALLNCSSTVVTGSTLTISGTTNFINTAQFNGNNLAIAGKLSLLDSSSTNNNVIDLLATGQLHINSNSNTNNNISVKSGGKLFVNGGGNLISSTLNLLGSLAVDVGQITKSNLTVAALASVNLSNGGSIVSGSSISLLGTLTSASLSLIKDSSVDIQSGGSLSLSGGSIIKSPLSILGGLTVGTGSQVSQSNLTVQAGATTTLNGGGSIVNSPLINLLGSVVVNTGSSIKSSTFDIKSNGILNLAGGVLDNSPLSLLGKINLNSAASITSSPLNILSSGLATLSSTSTIVTSTVNLVGGQLSLLDTTKLVDSTISIASGGILDLTNSASITGALALGITNGKLNLNSGLISGSNISIDSALGTLNFLDGQLTNSPINIVGGLLNMTTGTITGSAIKSSGSIQFGSGNINQSPLTILNGGLFNMVTGVVTGSAIECNGAFTVKSGNINQSPFSILADGVLNLVAGTITGSNIQSNGSITMSSGNINQSPISILANGVLNLVAGTITGSDIQANGVITMSSGNIKQSPISVLANGVFEIVGGALQNSPVSILTGAITNITQATIVDSTLEVTGTLNSLLNVAVKAVTAGVVPIVTKPGGILNVAGELALSAVDNLVISGASSVLNLAKDTVVTLGETIEQVSHLDIQIDSLGATLQSLGGIQLANQLNPLNLLSIVSQALTFDSGSIHFSNGLLSVTDSLSFTEKGQLTLDNSVISLSNTVNDLVMNAVDLVMDSVTLQHESHFIPPRILIGDDSTLVFNKVTIDSTIDAADDTAYTLVFSPTSPIMCNGQVVNNGSTGQSTYQFLCDNKLVVLKFSNCSGIQCPGNASICVDSIDQCPDVNGTCNSNGLVFKCWNGQCASSLSTCPALPSCPPNTQRCPDSSCTTATECISLPNTTYPQFNFNGCPIGFFQCGDGTCSRNISKCCNGNNCQAIPVVNRAVKSKSPFDTTRSLILPILSRHGNNNSIDIYGYINVPTNFTNQVNQNFMKIQSLDDSYLDQVNGTHIWGTNGTYRDSALSLIFNITIDHHVAPLSFLKDIEFQFKINPEKINMTTARLAFINTTTNSWQLLKHVQRCDVNNGSLCGTTNHFTSFGVLTNFNDDGTDGEGGYGATYGSGLPRKTMIIIASTVVGGVAIMGAIAGFFLVKIVKHGSLKYWWASKSRGGHAIELN
ncbi:hypothetical protein PPL_08644 [Heterostelium album PN500]|uniref:Uncharacterized protein n=1 Tax=Heterostelium pallidum (strain ATCC 26659 / Pp 5 / PN500) TaxID=670386 RepID=D3BJB9_HETP5|nr:hypothetical protein PPL_08644 [Heterostelium album PN500]EFA77999.1 hypothetical protein PPL_08644 [Heterostelium album PN500]|eukprot:XP_020430127.1 hypothetical protein PPL_08644 [Heterostelium album PN500]